MNFMKITEELYNENNELLFVNIDGSKFTERQLRDLRSNTARHLASLEAAGREDEKTILENSRKSLAEYDAFFAEQGLSIE